MSSPYEGKLKRGQYEQRRVLGPTGNYAAP
jgi:hypothetical protein